MNIFDIIGPIMIGPSSSHTAGAVRLGLIARRILDSVPKKAYIYLYGSFASTYKGHGTDLAIIAGILGFSPDNEKIPLSFQEAEKQGLYFEIKPVFNEDTIHPNTAVIKLVDEENRECTVQGASLGGGRIMVTNIDDFPLELTGQLSSLLTIHNDKAGIVAKVSAILAKLDINIASMKVFRRKKGGLAAMIIETDQILDKKILPIITAESNIISAKIINSIP